jgi:hypothetical protein
MDATRISNVESRTALMFSSCGSRRITRGAYVAVSYSFSEPLVSDQNNCIRHVAILHMPDEFEEHLDLIVLTSAHTYTFHGRISPTQGLKFMYNYNVWRGCVNSFRPFAICLTVITSDCKLNNIMMNVSRIWEIQTIPRIPARSRTRNPVTYSFSRVIDTNIFIWWFEGVPSAFYPMLGDKRHFLDVSLDSPKSQIFRAPDERAALQRNQKSRLTGQWYITLHQSDQ